MYAASQRIHEKEPPNNIMFLYQCAVWLQCGEVTCTRILNTFFTPAWQTERAPPFSLLHLQPFGLLTQPLISLSPTDLFLNRDHHWHHLFKRLNFQTDWQNLKKTALWSHSYKLDNLFLLLNVITHNGLYIKILTWSVSCILWHLNIVRECHLFCHIPVSYLHVWNNLYTMLILKHRHNTF